MRQQRVGVRQWVHAESFFVAQRDRPFEVSDGVVDMPELQETIAEREMRHHCRDEQITAFHARERLAHHHQPLAISGLGQHATEDDVDASADDPVPGLRRWSGGRRDASDLPAQPSVTSVFTGWTGACLGQMGLTCTMIVNGPITVGGAFAALHSQLDVTITPVNGGTGSVTSDPSGINCGTSGSVCAGATFARKQSLPGRVNGQGIINGATDPVRFQFNARQELNGSISAKLDISVGKKQNSSFEATSLVAAWFGDDVAELTGVGRWNGQDGYAFEVRAADLGEPGKGGDRFNVTIRNADGAVVLSSAGVLTSGNIQALLQQ